MNAIVRRAGLQHMWAALSLVPYRVSAELVDTSFDMSTSLIGVDVATRPH